MDDDISLNTVELRSAVTTGESTMPLLINRERARNRRASESEEAREKRLVRDRARGRQRLASETVEEREVRVSRRRAQERARRAARTSQARETRLHQQRTTPEHGTLTHSFPLATEELLCVITVTSCMCACAASLTFDLQKNSQHCMCMLQ